MHECKGEMLKIECGCVVEQCKICGVSKSVEKCEVHKPIEHDSRTHYCEDMRGCPSGLPRHAVMCGELLDALWLMGMDIVERKDKKSILDIGAGIGLYAPLFIGRGYRYTALELNSWACEYIQGAYRCMVLHTSFEKYSSESNRWGTLTAAHVLEHLTDAPKMLEKMFRILQPRGILYMVVPEDTDLGNPDHKWFFNKRGIVKWFEEIGFKEIKVVVKKVIDRENFIYITGVKPNGL